MKIDLFTRSRELQDIIIKDYKGKFFPETQYEEDSSIKDEPKQFCFFELELETLSQLLDNYSQYEYEIRDSKSGDFIEYNQGFNPAELN